LLLQDMQIKMALNSVNLNFILLSIKLMIKKVNCILQQ